MSYEKGPESVSSTTLYLEQIGHHPLLTAQEEVVLAKRIETGRQATDEFLDLIRSGAITDKPDLDEAPVQRLVQSYDQIKILENQQKGGAKEYPLGSSKSALDLVIDKLKTGSLLATDEMSEAELLRLKGPILRGAKAREVFINSNLRLVVSIAKKHQGTGIPLLDLVQEGNMGLSHAVDKFDYRKGFKFSTYATWWVRQAISRGISYKSGIVRLPAHIHEKSRSLQKYEHQMPGASDEELAQASGLEMKVIQSIRQARNVTNIDSIDRELSEDSTTEFGDLIPDDVDVEGEAVTSSEYEEMYELLEMLTDQEKQIMYLRYGLKDGIPKTLDEVGRVFGVTRERIRQIESRSFKKLRGVGAAKYLPPDRARQVLEDLEADRERQKQAKLKRNQRSREKTARARALGKISTTVS